MKETETAQATPEQLLKLLDLQLASQRQHREKAQRSRTTMLVGGVLLIVVAATAALLMLAQMIEDYRSGEVRAEATTSDFEQR